MKRINILIILGILIIYPFNGISNPHEQKIFCISNKVLIREKPDSESKTLSTVNEGEQVILLDESKNKSLITINGVKYEKSWYKIQTSSGITGWSYSLFYHSTYYSLPQFKDSLSSKKLDFVLYPIGWSADNIFAFISEQTCLAAEAKYIGFYLFDANNNKYIYSEQKLIPFDPSSLLNENKKPLMIFWNERKFFLYSILSKYIVSAGGIRTINTGSNTNFDYSKYKLKYQTKSTQYIRQLIIGYSLIKHDGNNLQEIFTNDIIAEKKKLGHAIDGWCKISINGIFIEEIHSFQIIIISKSDCIGGNDTWDLIGIKP